MYRRFEYAELHGTNRQRQINYATVGMGYFLVEQ